MTRTLDKLPEGMTVAEAARVAGVSVSALRGRVERAKVGTVVDGRRRLSAQEVARLLDPKPPGGRRP